MYAYEFVSHETMPYIPLPEKKEFVRVKDVNTAYMPDEAYFDQYTGLEKFDIWGTAGMCRTGLILHTGGAFMAPCKRWMSCVDCFQHRAYQVYQDIQMYVENYPGDWCMVTGLSEEEACVIAREAGIYIRFPTYRHGVVLLSPNIEGESIPTSASGLLDLASDLCVTLRGKRISYRPRKPKDVRTNKKAAFYSPDATISDIREILDEKQVIYKEEQHCIDWVISLMSDTQMAYELVLRGKKLAVKGIIIISPYDTIFAGVRDGRAENWVDPSERAYLDAIGSRNKVDLVA